MQDDLSANHVYQSPAPRLEAPIAVETLGYILLCLMHLLNKIENASLLSRQYNDFNHFGFKIISAVFVEYK
jgi:hypothetical protein